MLILPLQSCWFRVLTSGFRSAAALVTFACVKYTVHKAASSWAHGSLGFVAACLQKWASYSSHSISLYSMLALTIMELYASRSALRSGSRMMTMAVKMLKHSTHSWIDAMRFLDRTLSVLLNKSKTMGSGAPNWDGSSSHKSIYSPLQMRSAAFFGTKGKQGPMLLASVDGEVWGPLNRLAGEESSVNCGVGFVLLDEWPSPMVRMPARA